MNKKIVAGLCLIMVAAIGAAQTENDKSNLLTKAKAFLNRSVVHGVDTNYVKTPSRPWQISVKSRVAQTDLQMHSIIDGTDLFDGESMMPFVMGVGDMAIDPRIMTKVSTSLGVKVGYKGLLQTMRGVLTERPQTWQDCVLWAFGHWQLRFHYGITQLLRTYPPDKVGGWGSGG